MSSSDLYDTLKATALAHIRAHESTSGPTSNPFDPENIYAHRLPTCVMHFHPGSGMPPPFNGAINKDQHVPAILTLGALMSSVKIDVHEILIDVMKRTVAARMTMKYVFKAVKSDPKELKWPIEYVWITEMDESGGKIVRMEECLDTARAGVMLKRAAEYVAENAK